MVNVSENQRCASAQDTGVVQEVSPQDWKEVSACPHLQLSK